MISQPPLIPLIIPSFYNASNHVSDSTTLFYPGFNHISPLDPSLSAINNIKSSPFSFYMAFLKALSLVLFFSFFTQLHLATSFLSHQSITSSMLMTLSSSFLLFHATSNKTFNSYKTPFLKSHPGWLPTSFLSTPLKLISTHCLPTQLAKIDNPSLSMPSSTSIKPVASARSLGVIFDSNLSFSDHISYISKTCFAHILILDVFVIL